VSSLSILIPTYNRSKKLLRLLNNIEEEISYIGKTNLKVDVVISDNASIDDTGNVVASFISHKYRLSYFRQDTNVGFDRNIKFLYEKADSDYVWFLADDDILLPSAIQTVIHGLAMKKPDVMLFSFIQPPGSTIRTFNFPEPFNLEADPKRIIKYVAQYPKLSTYIMRKISFTKRQDDELAQFCGHGYYFVCLCYSILSISKHPRLCVISEPLASCDDDYINISYGPTVFLDMYKVYLHPFVVRYLPDIAKEQCKASYYSAIQLMFSVKMGTIISDDEDRFNREIREFKIDYRYLVESPRALLQLLLLKTDLVFMYKVIKRFRNAV